MQSPDEFSSIDVFYVGDAAVFRLGGEIDIASFGALKRCLAISPPEGCTSVVVDCSALTFLDVAGARAVHQRAAELRSQGFAVEIRGVSGVVEKVLSFVAGDGDERHETVC